MFFKIIIKIIIKNLKFLLRSPSTIIVLIFIPIILMFLVGLTFSGNSFNNLNIGFINTDENNLFNFNKHIKPIPYNNNNLTLAINDCIKDMDLNKIHICVTTNFTNLENNTIGANIDYYIDNTRLQISEIVASALNAQLASKEREISNFYITMLDIQLKESTEKVNVIIPFIDSIGTDLDSIENDISSFKINIKNKKKDYSDELINLSNFINYLEFNEKKVLDIRNDIEKTIKSTNILIDEILLSTQSSVSSINILLNTLSNLIPKNLENDSTSILLSNLSSSFNELDLILKDLSIIKTDLDLIEKSLDDFDTLYSKKELLYILPEKISVEIEKIENFENSLDNISLLVLDNKVKFDNLKLEFENKLNDLQDINNLVSPSKILDPLKVKRINRFPDFTKIHQMIPVVTVMILLFIGILLSTTIVSLELDSKAYHRNLLLPVNQSNFIIALFFTSFIISYLEILILFTFFFFSFDINVFKNVFSLNFIIIHILSIFILFGLFIGYVFNNRQLAILVSTFSAIGLFLVSNILLPLELMPKFFSYFVQYNPVVIGIEFLRQIFYYPNYNINLLDFLFLYFYIFILFSLLRYAYKKRKENFNN